MIQRWTLPLAVMAAGLLTSPGWAQSDHDDTHVPGHKTGSRAAQEIDSAPSSGAPMPGHHTPRANARNMTTRQRMGGASRVSAMDRMFMVKAAHINIGEVKAGQLALTRAVNANVRDYAQMMITEHSRANMQLKRVAAQARVNLPNDTDRKHKAVANRLAKFSGAPFDREFMRAMVVGHQQAIALFQKEAQSGRDPQARAYATQMLPGLRKHLQHAQQLAGSRAVRTGEKMSPGANMNGSGQGGGAGDTMDGGAGGGTDQGGTGGGTDQGTDGGTDQGGAGQ